MVRLARTARCSAALLAALYAPATGLADTFFWRQPIQVDAVKDSHPRVSGRNVVWQHGTGSAAEIYFRNDRQIFPLTQDTFADELPEIDGTTVVWQHNDGNDYEIMSYDGSSNHFITNNAVDDNCPVTGGGSIGWQGTGILSREFFLFSSSMAQQITGDNLDEECPRASAGNYVWTKFNGSNNRDVWAWLSDLPMPGLYQITDTPTTMESSPAISHDRIVYVEGTGSSAEIHLFDGSDFSDTQLTHDGSEDRNPQIDGEHVAWEHFDGIDWEIYEYVIGSGMPPQQITNNDVDDHDPQLSGDSEVWVEDEPGHSQVWLRWHGGAPQRITKEAEDHADPHIDGDLIAFQTCGASGCDIWLAPEPSAGALALAALGTLAALARRR